MKPTVERELWARAAGRCQFSGCNRILYKSPVTQEAINISEKAHIYSFSGDGPRGWGPFRSNLKALNDVQNLLLVCHDCHKKIDGNSALYPAKLLIGWKDDHERRIFVVTGVDPKKKSFVVMYGANIGEQSSVLQPEVAKQALFPTWYPAEEAPIRISMNWEGRDSEDSYWVTEEKNLVRSFERQIVPLLVDGAHFSIFALAPMPLLIRLGTLLTDKVPVQVFQLHREPEQTWQWNVTENSTNFRVIEPESFDDAPALNISLSASVTQDRIAAALRTRASIWTLQIDSPNNDFLKSKTQLSEFRSVCRKLLVEIGKRHGVKQGLSVFPAMPVACAIEFGRIRMPKADMPWVIYDQNHKTQGFARALQIGGETHD